FALRPRLRTGSRCRGPQPAASIAAMGTKQDGIRRAESCWGIPHGECHRTDDAVQVTAQRGAAMKELAAAEPDNADHPHKLSWALINLAQLLSARREHARADAAALESVAIMRRMLAR